MVQKLMRTCCSNNCHYYFLDLKSFKICGPSRTPRTMSSRELISVRDSKTSSPRKLAKTCDRQTLSLWCWYLLTCSSWKKLTMLLWLSLWIIFERWLHRWSCFCHRLQSNCKINMQEVNHQSACHPKLWKLSNTSSSILCKACGREMIHWCRSLSSPQTSLKNINRQSKAKIFKMDRLILSAVLRQSREKNLIYSALMNYKKSKKLSKWCQWSTFQPEPIPWVKMKCVQLMPSQSSLRSNLLILRQTNTQAMFTPPIIHI